MEIKLDKYTLRFDPSEIRISIDGEKIDIGARTKEVLPEIKNNPVGYSVITNPPPGKVLLYNRDIAQTILPKTKTTKKKQ